MLLSKYDNIVYHSIKQFINSKLTSKDIVQLFSDKRIVDILYCQKLLLVYYQIYENIKVENLPIQCKVYIKHLFNNIKIKMDVMNIISNAFESEGINYAFVKGAALSLLIYGNEYSRQYNDIDIIVSENDINKACYIIEKMGFKESLFEHLTQNNILIDEGYKKRYFESDREKQFIGDNNILIELKRECGLLGIDFFHRALSRRVKYNINGIELYSFSLSDSLILMIWTVFENFMVEGNYLSNNFKARDIVDICMFWKVYQYDILLNIDTFKDDFQLIHPYMNKVNEVLSAFGVEPFLTNIEKFLSDDYVDIPEWLPYVDTDSSFLKKIFYNEWRITHYYEETYNRFSFNPEIYDLKDTSYIEKEQIYGESFAIDFLKIHTFMEIRNNGEYINVIISSTTMDFDLLYDIYFILPNQDTYKKGISHSKLLFENEKLHKKIDNRIKLDVEHFILNSQKIIKLIIPKNDIMISSEYEFKKIYMYFSVRLKNTNGKRFVANKGHFFSPILITFI